MYASIKLVVTTLVLPPGGPIVLVLLGLLLLRRRPRTGRALALLGAVALWLLSLPMVANFLVTALGGAQPLDLTAAGKADAIVILGGGVRPHAPEYGGDTLGRLTLERVRYGAFLARQTGLPVLVTGGAPDEDLSAEAHLMREALEREFGVPVRWVENRSWNTRENALCSKRLLAAEGVRRVVLVLHGFDVRRARRLFEAAGLEVIAAPTYTAGTRNPDVEDLLPSVWALQTAYLSLYEFMAVVKETVQHSASDPESEMRCS